MIRPLMAPLLTILIDSESTKSNATERILAFPDNEIFEIAGFDKIEGHFKVRIVPNTDGNNGRIFIEKLNSNGQISGSETLFGYRDEDIKSYSKEFKIPYEQIIKLFVFSSLKRYNPNKKLILVTDNPHLLRSRFIETFTMSFDSYSVLSSDEASLFIDLFCKQRGTYLVAPLLPFFTVDEGGWYLYSMKSKITALQLPWSILVYDEKASIKNRDELINLLQSLQDRVRDMLIAIDEIAKRYFSGTNNATLVFSTYHFNYWTTLYTGILDSLALVANFRYDINFSDQTKIGLRTRNNKEFLRSIPIENKNIQNLIRRSQSVIRLLYEPGLRDLIVHRERLKAVRFINRQERFDMNMLEVDEKFFHKVINISTQSGVSLESWGNYKSHGSYYIEPYRFVKSASSDLFVFINEYLEALNFKEFLTINPELKERVFSKDKSSSFGYDDTLRLFTGGRLGY